MSQVCVQCQICLCTMSHVCVQCHKFVYTVRCLGTMSHVCVQYHMFVYNVPKFVYNVRCLYTMSHVCVQYLMFVYNICVTMLSPQERKSQHVPKRHTTSCSEDLDSYPGPLNRDEVQKTLYMF